MAKKAPVVSTWEAQWGEENVIKGPVEELTHLAIKDDDDDETNLVEITPDGAGGALVKVGPIEIAIRKPTTGEKRKGWERVVEVTQGLDDENVLLGDECGAVVPEDGDDEEAE